MHGARLHKTFRRDAMARDPRRDLLRRDWDILLRDWDETKTLRILSETRPRRDVSTSRDRLETETSRPRPHPCCVQMNTNFVSSVPPATALTLVRSMLRHARTSESIRLFLGMSMNSRSDWLKPGAERCRHCSQRMENINVKQSTG